MSEGLRVVHVVPTLDPSKGGPSRCVLGLAQAQAHCGANVDLVAGAPDASLNSLGQFDFQLDRQRDGLTLNYGSLLTRHFSIPGPDFSCKLYRAIQDADIVHLHSLWNGVITKAGWIGRRLNKPMILSPHGMLVTHNMRVRGRFKGLYLSLLEQRNLAALSAFHFLDETERTGCGWLEPARTLPSVIQPNGLELNCLRQSLATFPNVFQGNTPQGKRTYNIVFLGRLNVIKGLELQLEVLADCLAAGLLVRLHWIGPDDGEWPGLRKRAAELGVMDALHWHGPIYGDERLAWLRDADAVLLTSLYECNSVSAGETLAVGGVLLATDTCHLARPAVAGAAVMVSRNRQQLSQALMRMLLEPCYALALREAGIIFASKELGWTPLASRMLGFYQSILDGSVAHVA